MREVILRCEHCEEGCSHCDQRGYVETFGTPEEALASFAAVADDIINDEDGEPYMWDFILRVSLLEVVE